MTTNRNRNTKQKNTVATEVPVEEAEAQEVEVQEEIVIADEVLPEEDQDELEDDKTEDEVPVVQSYTNTLPNSLDLRGASFLPGETKELTDDELENKRVQYAIEQGVLVKAE